MKKMHTMRLDDTSFNKIESGVKKVEIRLLDPKRKLLKEGDEIIFTKRTDLNKKVGVRVRVNNLFIYENFEELFKDLGKTYFPDYGKKQFVDSCRKIYPKEKTDRYKALAIILEKIAY